MSVLGKWITNETAAPFYARKKFVIGKEIKGQRQKCVGWGNFTFI